MRRVIFMGIFLYITLQAMHKAHADVVLDRIMVQAAHEYKVPVRVLRSIAQVESRGGLNAGLHKNLNGTFDFGPLQINSVHWNTTCKHLNVAVQDGNVKCGALILSRQLRYIKTEPVTWWSRYHSRTPAKRSQYEARVRKILQGQSDGYTLYLSK